MCILQVSEGKNRVENLCFCDDTCKGSFVVKAVTYQGIKDIEAPTIKKKDDIIVKITSTAICESDLHIYQGYSPT